MRPCGGLDAKGDGHLFDDELSYLGMRRTIVDGDVLVDRAAGAAHAVTAAGFHPFPNPFLAGA